MLPPNDCLSPKPDPDMLCATTYDSRRPYCLPRIEPAIDEGRPTMRILEASFEHTFACVRSVFDPYGPRDDLREAMHAERLDLDPGERIGIQGTSKSSRVERRIPTVSGFIETSEARQMCI